MPDSSAHDSCIQTVQCEHCNQSSSNLSSVLALNSCPHWPHGVLSSLFCLFRICLRTAVFLGTFFFLTLRLFLAALDAFLLHLVEHSASTSATASHFKEPKSLGWLEVKTVGSGSWSALPSDATVAAMVKKPDSKGWLVVPSDGSSMLSLVKTLGTTTGWWQTPEQHIASKLWNVWFLLLSAILSIVSAHKCCTVRYHSVIKSVDKKHIYSKCNKPFV